MDAAAIVDSQLARAVKQRQSTVDIAMHPNLGANVGIAMLISRDLQAHTFKAHAVIVAHRTISLLAQDIGLAAADERHKRCAR